jgi:Na+-translocating ferredoxin:NAD+ oxidoreductase RnfD subunit
MFESGGLLLFAFHMISDPKTTPDSRAGRIVFAALVALGAGFVQFVLYRTNGLLWSLAVCSLLVPLLDRWLPGSRYTWSARMAGARPKGEPDATDVRTLPVPVGARAAAMRA